MLWNSNIDMIFKHIVSLSTKIACNEKALDHFQFLNVILRDFKNTVLLKSRGQTPEDLRFQSKSHV